MSGTDAADCKAHSRAAGCDALSNNPLVADIHSSRCFLPAMDRSWDLDWRASIWDPRYDSDNDLLK